MAKTRSLGALVLVGCLLVPALAGGETPTERLWKARCASCHGPGGKGDTAQGKQLAVPDLSAAAWQKQVSDDQIRTAIERGSDGARAKQIDHAFAGKLKPDQIAALVRLIRGLSR